MKCLTLIKRLSSISTTTFGSPSLTLLLFKAFTAIRRSRCWNRPIVFRFIPSKNSWSVCLVCKAQWKIAVNRTLNAILEKFQKVLYRRGTRRLPLRQRQPISSTVSRFSTVAWCCSILHEQVLYLCSRCRSLRNSIILTFDFLLIVSRNSIIIVHFKILNWKKISFIKKSLFGFFAD